MPNSLKCQLKNLVRNGLLRERDLKRIIIIPEGATNEDIIKLMFPNKYGEQCGRTKVYYNIDAHNRMEFQIDWWEAPYKESEKV